MPNAASFESFEKELNRLVGIFGRGLGEFKSSRYVEAQLRDDFLNPFFRALGWDLENSAGLIQPKREVEIESRTEIGGRQKRADYLFRTDGHDRFVCEAKKPAEELHSRYAFQTKRYAWNKNLPLAVLTDFEEFKIYIVGGKPHADEPDVGLWKTWHFRELPLVAQEIWNLLARDKIATGSIDQLLESLPKTPAGKGKARQQWLIKPDRSRSLDVEFLNLLDEARRELAGDLLKNNDREDLLEGNKLNEAVQHILDRILFLRICEDRDIDTGVLLVSIVETWRRNFDKEEGRRAHQKPLELREEPPAYFGSSGVRAPKDSLWRVIVRHFRALDRRPPTHVPYFNGNLFKPHLSEELIVSDEWLAGFVADLSDDESPYLFSYIPVEILGTIYERFLGKVVRPQGRGVTIEEKPEVRKAGGVYYTPRYIVEYIVAQTVEKLLHDAKPEATLKFHFLDPACGSGSFLIRVFEAVCEHWQQWFTDRPDDRKKKWCWVDEKTGDVHLTMSLKRQILTSNVFGVDLDPGAVEVTQLSLYLKMLENENRTTLQRQRELLPNDDDALLPPLENNIKCGNSLIASDFSMISEDLVRVRAFDWKVGFEDIMKAGGFDAVVGNPPYIRPHKMDLPTKEYFWRTLKTFVAKSDIYSCFMEKGLNLLREGGHFSFIVPHTWTSLESFEGIRRKLANESEILLLVQLPKKVFQDATVETCIFALRKCDDAPAPNHKIRVVRLDSAAKCESVRIFSQADIAHGHLYNFQLYAQAETAGFASRLKSVSKPLSEFIVFVYGFKTAHDDKFIHPDARYKDSRPFIRSAAIHRYCHDAAEEFVWYVPEKMKANRTTARPGEAARFESEKVMVARMGKELIASYDKGGLYVKDAMLLLPKGGSHYSLKYLLALINSRLLGYFYKEYFVTIDVLKNAILDLPIRAIDFSKAADKSRHDKLVLLVDKLLVLMPKLRAAKSEREKATLQNAVTAADQQIDALVYDLYGLTEKEIKLVEGAQ
jgi:hypothetical protein